MLLQKYFLEDSKVLTHKHTHILTYHYYYINKPGIREKNFDFIFAELKPEGAN